MDKNGKEQFYSSIGKIKEDHDLAVLIVSHDFAYVKKYADKVVMIDKTVVAEGTPEEVFKSKVFIDTFGEV
jgi:zinc transport system ATP-binding protein